MTLLCDLCKNEFFQIACFQFTTKNQFNEMQNLISGFVFFLQMKSIKQRSFNSIIIIQFLSAREKMLHINDFLRNE